MVWQGNYWGVSWEVFGDLEGEGNGGVSQAHGTVSAVLGQGSPAMRQPLTWLTPSASS